jgi:hypothetical protein
MTSNSLRQITTGFILFCMMGAMIGCNTDIPAVPTLAGVDPEVVNNEDTFEFQVSSVENYTGAWTYNWMTTGTVVNVDQSSAVTSGDIVLSIKDSDGKTVYTGDMSQGGSFTTEPGTTGQWTIVVALVNGSGTLNFRTEKNK